MFNSLNRMVLNNLNTLQALWNVLPEESESSPVLFQITASLSAPEVIVSPSFNEVSCRCGCRSRVWTDIRPAAIRSSREVPVALTVMFVVKSRGQSRI